MPSRSISPSLTDKTAFAVSWAQMRLPPEERDRDCTGGKYLEIYRQNYKSMIMRRGMPPLKRIIYTVFRAAPQSAVLAGRLFALRK